MTAKKVISEMLRKERNQAQSWDEVSEKLYQGFINPTILSRIANPKDKYFPKDKRILNIMGVQYKPADNEEVKRTLVIKATVPELHKIQKKFNPRERTEKLLDHSV